jgi:hypothetical protein
MRLKLHGASSKPIASGDDHVKSRRQKGGRFLPRPGATKEKDWSQIINSRGSAHPPAFPYARIHVLYTNAYMDNGTTVASSYLAGEPPFIFHSPASAARRDAKPGSPPDPPKGGVHPNGELIIAWILVFQLEKRQVAILLSVPHRGTPTLGCGVIGS